MRVPNSTQKSFCSERKKSYTLSLVLLLLARARIRAYTYAQARVRVKSSEAKLFVSEPGASDRGGGGVEGGAVHFFFSEWHL